MRMPRPKLTYANVMATIAVFLALGGASYAATQLPKNSVTTKQIKQGSIQLSDLSKAARKRLAAAAGGPGPPGAPGAPGGAKAWAQVTSAGTVLQSSGNVTASNPKTGRYCVAAAPYTPQNSVAVVSPDFSDTTANAEYRVFVVNGTHNNQCPLGQWEVSGVHGVNVLQELGFTFIVG